MQRARANAQQKASYRGTCGLKSTTLLVYTSLFQSIVAVTLLSELQNGQENATSSFGFCFLGGGFDDFLLPMGH
jgi:hypothetical protein